jgi:hypothetical protein
MTEDVVAHSPSSRNTKVPMNSEVNFCNTTLRLSGVLALSLRGTFLDPPPPAAAPAPSVTPRDLICEWEPVCMLVFE